MFEEEYFRIIKEEDSFTSAEEGILFMAILHWTLAMRAWKRDKDTYDRSPQNGYAGANPSIYTDQWTREAKDNMKTYESMMRSLKLNREQRLKDIQRMGTSFLDFAERVAKSNEQAKIADDILALEHASEKELKKIQENGWMIGGGLPNNNPCQYEAVNEEKEEDVQETESIPAETQAEED
jgi:predicted alpha-1,6-mannanase (GH76 family)